MKLVTYAAVAAALVTAGSAAGGTIYDNGPKDGTVDAWKIGVDSLTNNFQIANTFTAGHNNFATGMTFESWEMGSANAMTSVNWAIYNGNPFSGGTQLYSGTASVTSTWDGFAGGVFTGSGYSLYSDSISFGSNLDVSVNCGGACWILLSNATDQLGDMVYWDENNGPSTAWSNFVGNLNGWDRPGTNSETFSILGIVPEPAAWALMLVGFAGLGAALRSQRKATLAI